MADEISFRFIDNHLFNDALDAMTVAVSGAARSIVSLGGHIIEARAKANFKGTHAKGQPHVGGLNPNIVTGTAKRSIKVKVEAGAPGSWRSLTGPTVIYGRRLELGFHGSDSLGRVYDQPGYPYLGPAFDASQGDLAALAEAQWGAAIASITL